MAMAASLESAGGAADFSVEAAAVESVGEQKMYVLPEALTVENGETKQTALVYAENVPVTPEYFLAEGYYGEAAQKVEDLPRLTVSIRILGWRSRAFVVGVGEHPASTPRRMRRNGNKARDSPHSPHPPHSSSSPSLRSQDAEVARATTHPPA